MSDDSEMQQAVEISMGPNSALLILSPTFLSSEQRESIRGTVDSFLKREGRNCLVLEGGMTAVVLHRDDEDGDEGGPTYLDGSQ